MKLITRSQWQARIPSCSTSLPIRSTIGMAVHYSGTASELGKPGAGVMRAHQNFHMDDRDWCDIAYNFEIDDKGNIYEGRGWNQRSAANGTNEGNDDFYAVCYQGADKENFKDFTVAAGNALTELFKEYRARAGRWPTVKPHRAFVNTPCPGNEIVAYLGLKPWLIEFQPWPVMLPTWWWSWNAWRLGEGELFKEGGPRNLDTRHLTDAPENLGGTQYAWVWLRAKEFDRKRKEATT